MQSGSHGHDTTPLQVTAAELQMSTYPMTFQGPSLRHHHDVEELDALKSSTLSTSPASGTMYKSSHQQSLFSSSTIDLCTDFGDAIGERRQQPMDHTRSVAGTLL